MKKIRAKLLSSGNVLISVTTVMHTDKGHEYSSTDHFELAHKEAEILLYDLHAVVDSLRGFKRKQPSRFARLAGKIFR